MRDDSTDHYRSGDPYAAVWLRVTRLAKRRVIKAKRRARYERQYANRSGSRIRMAKPSALWRLYARGKA